MTVPPNTSEPQFPVGNGKLILLLSSLGTEGSEGLPYLSTPSVVKISSYHNKALQMLIPIAWGPALGPEDRAVLQLPTPYHLLCMTIFLFWVPWLLLPASRDPALFSPPGYTGPLVEPRPPFSGGCRGDANLVEGSKSPCP